MGYVKVVQYGNVTEVYEYEKEHKQSSRSKKKLLRKRDNRLYYAVYGTSDIVEERRKRQRLQSQAKGVYKRSEASVKRSKKNFFRMCHHNNCLASSIHFLTLTFAYDLSYSQATRHVARFMERVRQYQPEIPVDFISVPELTKKNRFHFHLLVYNLSPEVAGRSIFIRKYNAKRGRVEVEPATTERFTRNLQMLFERGYVDIVPATYTSEGIAGYMAKYMAKSLTDTRYKTTRGYNCSRGIEKIRSAGGNSFGQYLSLVIPTEDIEEVHHTEYNVPYLGRCRVKKIITTK
jgi:hypothetical protein